jgi:hypothetical protein
MPGLSDQVGTGGGALCNQMRKAGEQKDSKCKTDGAQDQRDAHKAELTGSEAPPRKQSQIHGADSDAHQCDRRDRHQAEQEAEQYPAIPRPYFDLKARNPFPRLVLNRAAMHNSTKTFIGLKDLLKRALCD